MYIYAETAFHHEGDVVFLKKLIEETAGTGCHGIKFQVLPNAADFISTRHSQHEALSSYCLNYDEWRGIFDFTKSRGLDIILMPLSVEALNLADEFEVRYLDLHSVSFYDDHLVEGLANRKEDIILGIGGRTEEEVNAFYHRFQSRLKVLMVGFQSFPSKLSEMRLGRIARLKEEFPDLEIGYADHSGFDEEDAIRSNEYARLLGATVFEKHVTITEGLKRVDYESAIGIERFSNLIDRLNFIDTHILNTAEALMFPAELVYRNRQAKLVAKRDIAEGEVLTDENLALKMIDAEAFYTRLSDAKGKRAPVAIPSDAVIPEIKDETT